MTGERLAVDRCNCLALRRAMRRVTQFYDTQLAPAGLRITQFTILSLLHECDAMAVGDIGEALDMDRTTAGKNLLPLQRDGLVDVTRSAADGRARQVTLTPHGREVLRAATPLWRRAQAEFEQAFGRDESAHLRGHLDALRFD